MPSPDLQKILQRIRNIAKEYGLDQQKGQLATRSEITGISDYLQILDSVSVELANAKTLEGDYCRLQEILQQEEASNRARIGFQQQMRHYCDSLKSHISQLEQQKLELLQNTKEMIRSLKKTNEQLYFQLHSTIPSRAKQKHNKNQSVQSFKNISQGHKALSLKKNEYSDPQSSPRQLNEIVKTEAICTETDRVYVPKLKTRNIRSIQSISQAGEQQKKTILVHDSSKTYQMGPRTDRQLLLRKKNRKKNVDLVQFAKQQRRDMEQHLKSCYLKGGEKRSRPGFKQRVNRSVNSMMSVSSRKQRVL